MLTGVRGSQGRAGQGTVDGRRQGHPRLGRRPARHRRRRHLAGARQGHRETGYDVVICGIASTDAPWACSRRCSPSRSSRCCPTLARRIGEPIAVALGNGAADTAAALAEHRAVTVLTADAPEFAAYLVVPKVDARSPPTTRCPRPPRCCHPPRRQWRSRPASRSVSAPATSPTPSTRSRRPGPGRHPVRVRHLGHHQFPCIQGHPGHYGQAELGPVEALTVSFSATATGTKGPLPNAA